MYLLSSALIGFSNFGITNVLLNLYLLRLGYGPEFIGLVNGSAAVAFACSALPSGALGTRLGVRRMMLLGVFCLLVCAVMLPLVEFLPATWRSGGIVVSRLLSGLGFALYMVNANPFLVAATDSAGRNHAFSMQVALMPLAGVAGSLLGGVMPDFFTSILGMTLQDSLPYWYPLLIAAVFMVPAVLALVRTGEVVITPPEENRSAALDAAPWVLISVLALVAVSRMAGESAARSFFNVYMDDALGVSTATIGVLFAASQLVAGPATLAAPALIKRTGKTLMIAIGMSGTAAGFLLLALASHWALAGLGFIWAIAMLSVTRAVVNVYQMEIVQPGWRTFTSGATSMAMGMGYSSMAFGGGYLIIEVGYRGLFLAGTLLTLAGALLFWTYFRKPRGEYARQPVVNTAAATR
jgi:MFS family permease